ncbi:MAG: citrate synthase [Oscillospiraceae bacterium]|nr:citrate synthase [Oscillospiraceae bacterium]
MSQSAFDPDKDISFLCEESRKYTSINPADYKTYQVKRGLRNDDGSGVMAGLTRICNVHGYVIDDGEKAPVKGRLTYRGIDLEDIIGACSAENRFGFEEAAWLLLYGKLPTVRQLGIFGRAISLQRDLPGTFVDNVITAVPCRNIMNALQRAALALYTYDDDPDTSTHENIMRQSISLIAKMPTMMVAAYQVKRRSFDNKSMYFHTTKPELTLAENILRTMRSDRQFTDEEAKMLDLCLVLQMEHGGGNNSTFASRVLTSSGTDIYSAVSAGIGSLKGPRHGGANFMVMGMMDAIKNGVSNWRDETEVAGFIRKILNKEEGDGSGLVYGMGHAVYTISDPRAVLLKQYAAKMIPGTQYEAEFELIQLIEKLTPGLFREKKGIDAPLCANVDLYSGMVYTMLRVPPELMTPLFAVARTVGWCAHIIEEACTTGGRIIRPAYKDVSTRTAYVPLEQRT